MLALGGDGGTVTVLAQAAAPSVLGSQRVLVILVNFADNPIEPYSVSDAQRVVFGTTSDFFFENSYGQAWLSGDVVGWYTIPLASTNCDGFQIRDYAQQAAIAAGINLSDYSAFVYAFPTNSGCGYSGMAQIGGPGVWINGAQNMTLKTVGHELGHIFGLGHSHGLECGTEVIGSVISTTLPPPPGTCFLYDYGDYFDIMGLGVSPSLPQAHFNAFQKERLGWLGGAIGTVSADGTYWLDAFESAVGSNPKALKIPKSVDPQTGDVTWYYLEFRQAIGFDSPLSTYGGNVLNGVLVHTGSSSDPYSGKLLDMTPGSFSFEGYDWKDPALVVGQVFSDPEAGVIIEPVSIDGSGAAISVAFTCTRAQPTIAISPSESPSVGPGTAVAYTVSVTNNDNPGCIASSFNLQADLPAGWSATFSAPALTLDPGASALATLTVTSPASATGGSYAIGITATNGAAPLSSASTSATYVIACARANPIVVISPSQSQAVPAGTVVTYTVSITSNDGVSCGASSFELRAAAPSGWTASFSTSAVTLDPGVTTSTTLAVTSATGAAVGTYSLWVTATNASSVSYASTSSATYVLTSALNVSVSTDKSSYAPGQTVRLTARAIAGGSPVAKASVTVVTTKSNGTVASQSATTDSSGSAVFTIKLRPKDPVGLYNVRANAAKTPLSGSATTSFTVQ